MRCCPLCFADSWLKSYVRAKSSVRDDCDYCGACSVTVVPISELAPRFEAMMSLYRGLDADTILDDEDPLRIGDLLLNLVQDDWGVFSQRLISIGKAAGLLKHLANCNWDDDSGEPPFSTTDLYTRRISWSHVTLEEAFGYIISDLNEDPGNAEIPRELSEVLSEHLIRMSRTLRRGTLFYRGRPGCASPGLPYTGPNMSSPPPGTGRAGRANRAGVSVLYAARSENTVIAELRPANPNGPLSVCRMRTTRDLHVIDLVKRHPAINPFTTSEEHLGWDCEVAELLGRFGEELSTPVRSDDEPEEYRVTQQLCEAVRTAAYDGILYRSARDPRGTNLVVFDPGLCRIGRSWLVCSCRARRSRSLRSVIVEIEGKLPRWFYHRCCIPRT